MQVYVANVCRVILITVNGLNFSANVNSSELSAYSTHEALNIASRLTHKCEIGILLILFAKSQTL